MRYRITLFTILGKIWNNWPWGHSFWIPLPYSPALLKTRDKVLWCLFYQFVCFELWNWLIGSRKVLNSFGSIQIISFIRIFLILVYLLFIYNYKVQIIWWVDSGKRIGMLFALIVELTGDFLDNRNYKSNIHWRNIFGQLRLHTSLPQHIDHWFPVPFVKLMYNVFLPHYTSHLV